MIIYKTTNLINGKIYIGKDSKNNSKYLGSGLLLKRAILKYGKENFKKEILEECSSIEELNQREIFWINELDFQDSYNIALGGQGGDTLTHHPDLERIGKTISEGLKNSEKWQTMIHSEEHSKQLSESMKNSSAHKIALNSDSYKEKQSEANSGENNPMFGIHRYGENNPNYGNKWTKEQKAKASRLKREYYAVSGSPLIGIPKSEEHKTNISKAMVGKSLSDEHKNSIRETLLKREPINQYTIARAKGEEYILSEKTRENFKKANGGINNGFATLYIFNTPTGNELKLISKENVKAYFEDKFGKVWGMEYRLFNFKEFNGYVLKEKQKANKCLNN